jgi:ribosomal protein L16 Arg81 hydroxylase
MAYPREVMPLMRVALAAGDWLYIPCGYWHKAEAVGDEPSISLALGVLSPAALEILNFARHYLLQSLIWRQRLPVRGDASPLSHDECIQHYTDLCKQLGDDLAKTFRDPKFVRTFLELQKLE